MAKKSWYTMEVQASNPKAVDITIDGQIGKWDISSAMFNEDLQALGAVDVIHLHLNSPGGEVFDGLNIFNSLKAHKAKVKVFISGLAASMGSIIALAGDEITMAENSFYMIHQPTYYGLTTEQLDQMAATVADDAKMISDMAKSLLAIQTNLVNTYTKETGIPEGDVLQMLKDVSWLNAEKALEKGFITAIGEPVRAAAHYPGIEIPAHVKASLAKGKCVDCEKPEAGLIARMQAFAKNLFGMAARAGAALGKLLTDTITAMATGSVTRETIVAEMAAASGLTVDEVNAHVDGGDACPTLENLKAYASVLTVTAAQLQTAAESDGCEFATNEEQEAESSQQVFRQMNDMIIAASTQLEASQKLIADQAKLIAQLQAQPVTEKTAVAGADNSGAGAKPVAKSQLTAEERKRIEAVKSIQN